MKRLVSVFLVLLLVLSGIASALGEAAKEEVEITRNMIGDGKNVLRIVMDGEPFSVKAMQEVLTKNGWFLATRTEEGDRERFTFKVLPQAPKDFRTSAKGIEIPAAEAQFVKATRMEPTRDGAKVTYQVRLARPTSYFPAFQALYNAKVGDTKERHATYRKDGRSWILQDTDETFKKAE